MGGPREIFQKSPKRQPSFERRKSNLAQMALSSDWYALIVQRLEKTLAQTAAPKVSESPSYCNFGKVTQNPHFLKKCKEGTKGNFSKITDKRSSRLKEPKALWRKWHYPVISMHLKCKDWKRIWRKNGL